MLHTFRTTAVLSVWCLVASACSIASVPQQDTLATAPAESLADARDAMPKASPLDLDLLAALARSADADVDHTTVATQVTADVIEDAAAPPHIVPATRATYSSDAPRFFKSGFEPVLETLPVVPHDSDLLDGTVYDTDAPVTERRPVMAPGTYRTVEFKT